MKEVGKKASQSRERISLKRCQEMRVRVVVQLLKEKGNPMLTIEADKTCFFSENFLSNSKDNGKKGDDGKISTDFLTLIELCQLEKYRNTKT